MHAPEVTDYIKREAQKLDAVSDEVDVVNKFKGTPADPGYDSASVFDAEKNREGFRNYEQACDRVKTFYAVSQHPHPH